MFYHHIRLKMIRDLRKISGWCDDNYKLQHKNSVNLFHIFGHFLYKFQVHFNFYNIFLSWQNYKIERQENNENNVNHISQKNNSNSQHSPFSVGVGETLEKLRSECDAKFSWIFHVANVKISE